jgi:hypothetical protein
MKQNKNDPNSVLGKRRKLLGYVEVATLKKKWEAGEVNPVSVIKSFLRQSEERGLKTSRYVLCDV